MLSRPAVSPERSAGDVARQDPGLNPGGVCRRTKRQSGQCRTGDQMKFAETKFAEHVSKSFFPISRDPQPCVTGGGAQALFLRASRSGAIRLSVTARRPGDA